MKLRNKKTGEIINGYVRENGAYKIAVFRVSNQKYASEWYSSLAELNKDWEDYEEPEKYFWIDVDGFIVSNDTSTKDVAFETFKQNLKSIGNYFETREEAEKAREKLKAWKRLKDKGFRFDFVAVQAGIPEKDGVQYAHRFINIRAIMPNTEAALSSKDDLDLLFGGKE